MTPDINQTVIYRPTPDSPIEFAKVKAVIYGKGSQHGGFICDIEFRDGSRKTNVSGRHVAVAS